MKKLSFKTGLMAAAIGLAVISCGGGSGKDNALPMTEDGKIDAEALIKQQLEESEKQTEITAENWKSVIKNGFGIDVAVPQGWSFKDVKSYWNGETVIVLFTRNGDNAADPRNAAAAIFDATKAVSPEGNFIVDIDVDTYKTTKGKAYDSFDENYPPNKIAGGDFIATYWYYSYKGKLKVVNIDSDDGRLSFKFEHSKVTI
ncbi:MAG: hypothetical protein LBR34_11625 [Prevotella sp.]|jgi:hypothetical protein|nr:hypothetical protein [Prevotella sp.]